MSCWVELTFGFEGHNVTRRERERRPFVTMEQGMLGARWFGSGGGRARLGEPDRSQSQENTRSRDLAGFCWDGICAAGDGLDT